MADIHILTQVEVLNPIIVSLIPVASYVIFRRIFDPSDAALGALLMTFIHPFYFQLPALGRAATPVLFLVLTAVAITDTDLDPVLRKGLAIGFVAALATSHYGGSYFAMVAILTAVVLLVGTRLLDAVVLKLFRPNLAVRSDGGERDRNWKSIPSTSSYTLSATFALLYFVIVFGWFLYSRGGLRFDRFFERINVALTDFLTGAATPSGGTASRLTRDYGTASIELARWVYIFIAMLTAVGVLYLFVQRFAGTRWRNHEVFDEYFVLAAATLGTFSLTFFASGIWGGGRPMAIAFSIIALLAVAGAYAVITAPWKLYRRLVSSRDTSLTDRHRMAVRSFFAVILAVFVVLNTGAAAALVLGGGAPSSVPLQPEIEDRAAESPTEHGTVHFEQDLSMLVWLNTYADPDTGVIGDGRTRQRNNDIYGPQIAAGVEAGERQSFGWNPDLFAVVGHQGESYAVLSSYSVNLNVAEVGSGYTGAREFGDISEVNERLSREHRLYTTGSTEVYLMEADE
ncbi:MAG: DUF2206 domain-containing protein [Halovenus sp.]